MPVTTPGRFQQDDVGIEIQAGVRQVYQIRSAGHATAIPTQYLGATLASHRRMLFRDLWDGGSVVVCFQCCLQEKQDRQAGEGPRLQRRFCI